MSLADIEEQMYEAVEFALAAFIADGYTREVARLSAAVDDAQDAWMRQLMETV